MRKRNPEEIELIKNWLNFATENLLSAKSLITEEFTPFHTVCFMCQGSAEKYLKAYLIWKGWKLEKIHNLKDLLNYAIDFMLVTKLPFRNTRETETPFHFSKGISISIIPTSTEILYPFAYFYFRLLSKQSFCEKRIPKRTVCVKMISLSYNDPHP